MFIHLESWNYASDVTEEEIDDIAHDYFQSRKYIHGLKDGGWTYMCPTCDKKFLKLSAVYQHVEDIAVCSSAVKGHNCLAKLERLIAQNLQ